MRAPFVGVVALVSFAFGSQPASAVVLPVAGPFTGTAPYELDAGCSFIRNSMLGTAELSTLGASTVELSFCVSTSIHDVEPGGAFTITGADGTIVGDVPTGTVEQVPPPAPFHLELIVTGGTGASEGATGSLSVDGDFTPAGPVNAQITGTIDVPAPTPHSKADCKRGGWRSFTDDDGQPFTNQGRCVNSIVHNS